MRARDAGRLAAGSTSTPVVPAAACRLRSEARAAVARDTSAKSAAYALGSPVVRTVPVAHASTTPQTRIRLGSSNHAIPR